jgi:hypothetical protein
MPPPLRFLYLTDSLSQPKLAALRKVETETLKASLLPDQRDCLKVREDGTLLDGHHRVFILRERGVDVDSLPRMVIENET